MTTYIKLSKKELEELGFTVDSKRYGGMPYLEPDDGEAYPIFLYSTEHCSITTIYMIDYGEEDSYTIEFDDDSPAIEQAREFFIGSES